MSRPNPHHQLQLDLSEAGTKRIGRIIGDRQLKDTQICDHLIIECANDYAEAKSDACEGLVKILLNSGQALRLDHAGLADLGNTDEFSGQRLFLC